MESYQAIGRAGIMPGYDRSPNWPHVGSLSLSCSHPIPFVLPLLSFSDTKPSTDPLPPTTTLLHRMSIAGEPLRHWLFR